MNMISGLYTEKLYSPSFQEGAFHILISNGEIQSVESAENAPAESFDASGLNVAPGYIDLHIQGCGGFDFLDSTPEAVMAIRKMALKGGCTSLLATTTFDNEPGAFERLSNMIQAIREGSGGYEGARILGIHLEGPYMNPEKKGGFATKYFRKSDIAEFHRVMDILGDDLKMITIAPEMDGAFDLIKESLSRGVVVSLGHSVADYDLAIKAFKMGVNHITHFFNAMNGIHHRNPGLAAAALEDERVFLQIIPDGFHLHPSILKLLFKNKGSKRLCVITDATAPCGMPEATELEGVGGRIKVSKGAVRLPCGTLAGSALLMTDAVQRMRELTGISLEDIITMSTSTPANAISMEKKYGSVSPGQKADFVLFDDNFKIHYVILEGNLISV
jgi:N-acetylglucosamine-6-phosphate deacetylase